MEEYDSFWATILIILITSIMGIIFWINTFDMIWVVISCVVTLVTILFFTIILIENEDGR